MLFLSAIKLLVSKLKPIKAKDSPREDKTRVLSSALKDKNTVSRKKSFQLTQIV